MSKKTPLNRSNQKIVGVDLDYTLVNTNTTYNFILYALWSKKKFLRLFHYLILEFINRLSLNFLLKGNIKHHYISLLRGFKKSEIDFLAGEYVSKKLPKVLNFEMLELVLAAKKKKISTVLVSSSLEPLCKVISEQVGIDYFIGSELKYYNGKTFSGELIKDIQGNKLARINEMFKRNNLDLNGLEYYSDNFEDIVLDGRIGKFFGVYSEDSIRLHWVQVGVSSFKVTPSLPKPIWLFYVPSAYYFYSRYPLRELVYTHLPFFLVFLAFFSGYESVNKILLYWFMYISIYEIGYLLNDCVGNDNESSSRVPMSFCSNVPYFILSRITFFIFSSIILQLQSNVFYFGVANIALISIFLIHNSIPKQKRLITYPFLKTSHLLVPLIPLIGAQNLALVTLTIVVFYTVWESLYYYRKIYGKGDWNSNFRLKSVSLPKILSLLAFVLLGHFYGVPSKFYLLAFVLSIREFLQLIKFAVSKNVK